MASKIAYYLPVYEPALGVQAQYERSDEGHLILKEIIIPPRKKADMSIEKWSAWVSESLTEIAQKVYVKEETL
jgi:hypothetical protein